MARRIGVNNADILQNRAKEYEAEKGKNLATKEDITEITKKVEDVKTEISFSKQKRYEQLAEQERILLEIMYDVSKVAQSQNKLLLYLYDMSSRTRLDQLVDTLNDTMTHFYHLCNIAVVSIKIVGISDVIQNLSLAVSHFGAQVNVAATNAASRISQLNNQMDYALKLDDSNPNKKVWLEAGLQTKQEIEEMQGIPVDGKDQLNNAIGTYCLWLKQLYGQDFFIFKG